MASRPIRLLVVGAHPADAFDQAGGTLAHHAAEGDHVSALIVTGGVRSHDWRLGDRLVKAGKSFDMKKERARSRRSKQDEVHRACAILGIKDLHFLGMEDDAELLTQELIWRLAEKFREIRPDVVITHHPYEEGGFKMHATVGRAVMFARRTCRGSGRIKGRPHAFGATYFMNPLGYVNHNSLNQGVGFFRADVYVDITDVIEKKIRAFDCIESQYYGGSYSRKRAESADGGYGDMAQVSYAEQFQRYTPQVCFRLPVSDFELSCAEETKEQMMARRGYMVSLASPRKGGRPANPPYQFRRELYDR